MSSEPFNPKYALTDRQMLSFTREHGIGVNLLTLEDYNIDPSKANVYFVIYTGSEPNQFNTLDEKQKEANGEKFTFAKQPITHHWIGGFGNIIFDSYGYYGDYKWPENTEFLDTIPSRLQEFDSDVCGLYVLAYLHFCKQTTDYTNLGHDFVNHYGFTTDRNKNDNIVIQWYEEKKKQSTN